MNTQVKLKSENDKGKFSELDNKKKMEQTKLNTDSLGLKKDKSLNRLIRKKEKANYQH